MTKHKELKELVIPPAALADAKAAEMVRAWVANDDLHCTLRIGAWEDPAAWGVLLADLARHIAHAHHEQEGVDVDACLEDIREAFDAEMDSPTDAVTGEFAG